MVSRHSSIVMFLQISCGQNPPGSIWTQAANHFTYRTQKNNRVRYISKLWGKVQRPHDNSIIIIIIIIIIIFITREYFNARHLIILESINYTLYCHRYIVSIIIFLLYTTLLCSAPTLT